MQTRVHDRKATPPTPGDFAPTVVADPFDGEPIAVLRRLDVLSRMHSRNQIDDAGYEAGKRYQRICQAAEIGSLHGADFTREVVDGNPPRDFFSPKRLKAANEVARVDANVRQQWGTRGLLVMRGVLAEGQSLTKLAELLGENTNPQGQAMRSLSWLFVKCLEQVAVDLGYMEN